jgi:hypothetical protein
VAPRTEADEQPGRARVPGSRKLTDRAAKSKDIPPAEHCETLVAG